MTSPRELATSPQALFFCDAYESTAPEGLAPTSFVVAPLNLSGTNSLAVHQAVELARQPAHPEQCMTAPKVVATAMVLAGTVIYYLTCPACELRSRGWHRYAETKVDEALWLTRQLGIVVDDDNKP